MEWFDPMRWWQFILATIAACGARTELGGEARARDASLADESEEDATQGCSSTSVADDCCNPGGSCAGSAKWSCGDDSYEVDCSCGLAGLHPTCACSRTTSGTTSLTTVEPASCVCYRSPGATYADACGFQH